jgi:hypothetical protein
MNAQAEHSQKMKKIFQLINSLRCYPEQKEVLYKFHYRHYAKYFLYNSFMNQLRIARLRNELSFFYDDLTKTPANNRIMTVRQTDEFKRDVLERRLTILYIYEDINIIPEYLQDFYYNRRHDLKIECHSIKNLWHIKHNTEIKNKISPIIKKQADESKKRCLTHFKKTIDFKKLPHDIENLIFKFLY